MAFGDKNNGMPLQVFRFIITTKFTILMVMLELRCVFIFFIFFYFFIWKDVIRIMTHLNWTYDIILLELRTTRHC